MTPFLEMSIALNFELRSFYLDNNLLGVSYIKILYFWGKIAINSAVNNFSLRNTILCNLLFLGILLQVLCSSFDVHKDCVFLLICNFLLLITTGGFLNWIAFVEKQHSLIFKKYFGLLNKGLAIFVEKKHKNQEKNNKKKAPNINNDNNKYELFYTNNKIENLFYPCEEKNKSKNLGFEYLLKEYTIEILEKTSRNTLETQNLPSIKDLLNFCSKRTEKKIYVTISKDPPHEPKKINLTIKKSLIQGKLFFFLEFRISKQTKELKNCNNVNNLQVSFLTTISHELKTPLNGSLTFMEILKNEYFEDQNIKDLVSNCFAGLKTLENSLNNLIDYSLFISEQFILCLSDINLTVLMKEIKNITKYQIELKNLDLQIEIPSELSKKLIRTDYIRLKQVLLNITFNCTQFTNKGSISITLKICPCQPFTIEFMIRDTGIGMEEVFLKNLLTKINDENNELNLNSTGSCMALSISNKIVKLLGISKGLSIDSRKNEGTIIKFCIVDQKEIFDSKNIIMTKSFDNLNFVLNEPENVNKHIGSLKDSFKIESFRKKNFSKKSQEGRGEFSWIPEPEDELKSNSINPIYSRSNRIRTHNFDSIKKPIFWCDSQNSIAPSKFSNKTSTNKVVLSLKSNEIVIRENSNSNNSNSNNYYNNNNSNSNNNNNINNNNNNNNINSNNLCVFKNTIYEDNDNSFNFMASSNLSSIFSENPQQKRQNSDFDECCCEEILIVDDDAFNLLSLELILKNLGLKCVKAHNGKEAIEKFIEKKCKSPKCRGFKIIFMDYQMPIMNGVEATKEILGNISKKTVIIGCTAFTMKDQVMDCYVAGMKDVIFKPINRDSIINILREWLLT